MSARNEEVFSRYIVIAYYDEKTGRLFGPQLMAVRDGDADKYYPLGNENAVVQIPRKHVLLLRSYVSEKPNDAAAEIWFHKHYPPYYEMPKKSSAGWIGPAGRWYPCGHREHDDYAHRIAAAHYGTSEGTQRLERENWLRISVYGDVLWDVRKTYTQAQFDTLSELMLVSDGMYQQNIAKTLQDMLLVHGENQDANR